MNPWVPVSPCGDNCLTTGEPVVGYPRRLARIGSAIGLLAIALLASPALISRQSREWLARNIFGSLLRAFGIKLLVRGAFPTGRQGMLVVNNHISWLDIVALNAVRPMLALAKKEVGKWPLLGILVSRSGSIFLDRERLSTLPGTIVELAGALRAGSLVNVTPEATTYCGLTSGRFTAATFQAALDADVPVLPIALRYRLVSGRETTLPAFIGTESLIASLRRVIRMRGLVLEMHVCPPITPTATTTRKELAALAEHAIRSALGVTGLHPPVAVPQARTPTPNAPESALPVPESALPVRETAFPAHELAPNVHESASDVRESTASVWERPVDVRESSVDVRGLRKKK